MPTNITTSSIQSTTVQADFITNQAGSGSPTFSNGVAFAGSTTFGDGSAASPAITFTADTSTGIFRKAADSLGFSEGGVEVGSYDATGGWTFGVDGVALHVVRGTELRRIAGIASGDVTKTFYTGTGAGTLRATLGVAGASNGIVNGTAAGDFAINLVTGQGLRIGVNTTSIASATTGGAWTLGPSAQTSLIPHVINVSGLPGGAIASRDALALVGLNGNTDRLITRFVRNTTGADWIDTDWEIRRRIDSTDNVAIRFRNISTTSFIDFAAGTTSLGSVNGSGAWTLGPTTGTANLNTVYGFTQFTTTARASSDFAPVQVVRPSANTGPHIQITREGILSWGFGVNTSNSLEIGLPSSSSAYSLIAASVTNAGAWTLGPTNSTANNLVLNGRMAITSIAGGRQGYIANSGTTGGATVNAGADFDFETDRLNATGLFILVNTAGNGCSIVSVSGSACTALSTGAGTWTFSKVTGTAGNSIIRSNNGTGGATSVRAFYIGV